MGIKLLGICCTAFFCLPPGHAHTVASTPMTGRAVIASLFDFSDDRDDTIAKLKTTISNKDKTISGLNKTISELEKTISGLNNEIDDLNTQGETQKSQIENLMQSDNTLLWSLLSASCGLILGFLLGAFYTVKSISRTFPDK